MQVATSGHEIFPSLTSRPSRSSVFSMHSPIMLINAKSIVSGVFFDKISGWRWTSDIACSGFGRRRYCPLALEKRAVRNKINDNDGFVICVVLNVCFFTIYSLYQHRISQYRICFQYDLYVR